MLVAIYIEDDFRSADLALVLKCFSSVADSECFVVSDQQRVVTALSGLKVGVRQAVSDIAAADLLVILGGGKEGATFLGISDYLVEAKKNAKAIVALGEAATFVARSGLFAEESLTLPLASYKKNKNIYNNYQFLPLVVSGKLITTALPKYSKNAIYQALELMGLDAFTIFENSNLEQVIVADEREYKREVKHLTRTDRHYLKFLQQDTGNKHSAAYYLFNGVNALDILTLDNIISQLPFKVCYIGDVSGMVSSNLNIDFCAERAIQTVNYVRLLILPSGKGIEKVMVNQFLTYWLEKAAFLTYRILTIGEGEKLLGVSGALKDIDMQTLAEVELGAGKFVITDSAEMAEQAVINFAVNDYKYNVDEYQNYYKFNK